LPTVSEHRRYARVVQSNRNLAKVERPRPRRLPRSLPSDIIDRGDPGHRQRDCGAAMAPASSWAMGARVPAESVNDQDMQGLDTTRKRRVGIARHRERDQPTRRKEAAILRPCGHLVSADRPV